MRFSCLLFAFCGIALAQADQYNPIFRGEAGDVFSRKPNAFLVEAIRNRKPGSALDVGMGQGRNTIYLAQQGWTVTGFDPADEGVRRAEVDAKRLGLRISTAVTTIEQFDFGENCWDLIVMTYVPTKAVAPKVHRALRPGGAVVVEDRHLDTRRVWPAGIFHDNELISIFPGLRVLRYDDVWAPADWSAEGVNERLVRLLAEKPRPQEPGCLWEGKVIPDGGAVCWKFVTFRCQADGWQFSNDRCRE
jgi:SAM-dependent methyltransferase